MPNDGCCDDGHDDDDDNGCFDGPWEDCAVRLGLGYVTHVFLFCFGLLTGRGNSTFIARRQWAAVDENTNRWLCRISEQASPVGM